MKKIILLFVLFCSFALAQGWNSTVTTTINEPNLDKMDLFTNIDGNHILVKRSDGTIIYYNINSSGTVNGSKTETLASSGDFPNIVGSNDKIYAIYKSGNYIKGKYSTNGGTDWSTVSDLSTTSNTCNGVDAVYEIGKGTHVVWATKDSDPYYETSYYLLNISNSWVDGKTVTDYDANEVGGLPRLTLSSNKLHIAYNTGDGFDEYECFGSLKTRDKNLSNGNWEDPQVAWSESWFETSAKNQHLISDENYLYLFFTEYSVTIDEETNEESVLQQWRMYSRLLTGTWPFGNEPEYLPPGGWMAWHNITFSVSLNLENKIFVFYEATPDLFVNAYLYKLIIQNGTVIHTSQISQVHPLPYQLKSSSVSNDVYLVWRNEGSNYLSYQQYDEVPFAPQNLAVTVSSSNHPLLSWTKNNEPDVVSYTIEKAFCGYQQACTQLDWQVIGNTNQSYYVDELETYCTTPPPEACEGYSVWYRVKAVDSHPYESSPSNEVETTVNLPQHKIAVESPTLEVPKVYSLDQNYPNPFNPVNKISFGLPKEGLVTIKVFDVLGNEVAVLVDEIKPEGKHEVEFNANNLPSGIYIYKMQSGKFIAVNKMILLR